MYYNVNNNYPLAANTYRKSIQLYNSINQNHKTTGPLNNLASIYGSQGKYLEAIEIFKKCLFINRKLNRKFETAINLLNLGNYCDDIGKTDEAIKYTEESLSIFKNLDKKHHVIYITINLGNTHTNIGNYDIALDYFKKALSLSEELEDSTGLLYCYYNLGYLNFETQNFKLSEDFLLKSLKFSEKLNKKDLECETLLAISELFLKTNKHTKALNYAIEGKSLAYKLDLTEQQKEAHDILSKIYNKKKDYKKAFENHYTFKTLSDSLLNKQSIEKLSQLKYEYQYKNELEIAELKEKQLTQKVEVTTNDLKKSKQQLFIGIIVFLSSLLILGLALFYLKLRNVKAINQNIITEQRLLRTQMSPHFIFNALAVLQGIIISKEEEKSISYLSKFSKLLRTTLENSRDDLVALGKELLVIKNYIDLQNIDNNKNPIQYTINIDDVIDEIETLIPPMLIQPSIENAIEHGFDVKQQDKKLIIDISLIDKTLTCIITDNGKGINQQQIQQNSNKKSLSTKITKERLHVISKKYKQRADFSIKNNDSKGAKVTLIIPHIIYENNNS